MDRRKFIVGSAALAVVPVLPALPVAAEAFPAAVPVAGTASIVSQFDGAIYWLGANGFFSYDGNELKQLTGDAEFPITPE